MALICDMPFPGCCGPVKLKRPDVKTSAMPYGSCASVLVRVHDSRLENAQSWVHIQHAINPATHTCTAKELLRGSASRCGTKLGGSKNSPNQRTAVPAQLERALPSAAWAYPVHEGNEKACSYSNGMAVFS